MQWLDKYFSHDTDSDEQHESELDHADFPMALMKQAADESTEVPNAVEGRRSLFSPIRGNSDPTMLISLIQRSRGICTSSRTRRMRGAPSCRNARSGFWPIANNVANLRQLENSKTASPAPAVKITTTNRPYSATNASSGITLSALASVTSAS